MMNEEDYKTVRLIRANLMMCKDSIDRIDPKAVFPHGEDYQFREIVEMRMTEFEPRFFSILEELSSQKQLIQKNDYLHKLIRAMVNLEVLVGYDEELKKWKEIHNIVCSWLLQIRKFFYYEDFSYYNSKILSSNLTYETQNAESLDIDPTKDIDLSKEHRINEKPPKKNERYYIQRAKEAEAFKQKLVNTQAYKDAISNGRITEPFIWHGQINELADFLAQDGMLPYRIVSGARQPKWILANELFSIDGKKVTNKQLRESYQD